MYLVSRWVVSGLLAVQVYSLMYTSSGLELMVDDYCIRIFVDEVDVHMSIRRWNIIQAVLRRSAYVVEPCLLGVVTSEIVALLLTALQTMHGNGPLNQVGECAVLWG